jgi:hypothetical protein
MNTTRAACITGSMVLLLLQPQLQSQRPVATPIARTTAAATATPMPAGNAEHGRYLVEHVAMCIECHSGRDSRGVVLESERYLGAPIPFAPPWPNDWAMRAPRNRGLPGYTDELAFRLLTQGAIGRNGEQLRPPMPRFRMSAQDAADVIAYMRSPT